MRNTDIRLHVSQSLCDPDINPNLLLKSCEELLKFASLSDEGHISDDHLLGSYQETQHRSCLDISTRSHQI